MRPILPFKPALSCPKYAALGFQDNLGRLKAARFVGCQAMCSRLADGAFGVHKEDLWREGDGSVNSRHILYKML
jgi:hypothetical protein